MRVIYPDLLGDLGDQILPWELSLEIRQPVADQPSCLEQRSVDNDPREVEYVSSADLMEELIGFKSVSPDIERRMRNELGPDRFHRLMKLLFRLWETDRMI